MGDKPFLQIEFDEHYSKVGVITRIEAFLNSTSHRPPVQVPDGFNILDVDYHPTFITDRPAPDRTVLDRSGHRDTAIAAPILEELPQHAADPDLLLRAVLTGDVLYAALADMRAQLAPQAIPTWEELTRLAAQISALPPRLKSSGGRGKPAVRHLAQRGDSGHPRARGLSDRPYTPRRDALGALARQRHRRTGVARALEGAAHAARPHPRQRRGLQPRSQEAHRGGRPQPRGLRGQSGPLPLRQGAGARRARRRGAPLRAAL